MAVENELHDHYSYTYITSKQCQSDQNFTGQMLLLRGRIHFLLIHRVVATLTKSIIRAKSHMIQVQSDCPVVVTRYFYYAA